MIEVAVLFAAVIICAGVFATWTLRRDILDIRADVNDLDAAVKDVERRDIRAIRAGEKDLDERLAKLESRYGGPSFSEMLVGSRQG